MTQNHDPGTGSQNTDTPVAARPQASKLSRLARSAADQLKESLGIVDILADHGCSWSQGAKRGECPMCHRLDGDKNRPGDEALAILDAGTGYYCHRCHRGGSVIDLEMQLSGRTQSDFRDVLVDIAERHGVELPVRPDRRGDDERSKHGIKDRVRERKQERTALRLYRVLCADYIDELPDDTDEQIEQTRADEDALYTTCFELAARLLDRLDERRANRTSKAVA